MKKKITNIFALIAMFGLSAGQAAAQNCNLASDGYTLDWNDQAYPDGALSYQTSLIRDGTSLGASNSDPVGAIISVSGQTGFISANYPSKNANSQTGGFGAAEKSLLFLLDFRRTTDSITISVTFAEPVDDLSFVVLDVDMLAATNGTGGFRDDIRVTGFNGSTAQILPALTTPYNSQPQGQVAPSTVYVGSPLASNRALANGSNGNFNSNADQDLGNVNVNFSQPVRRVDIEYGRTSDYFMSNNPQLQGIAFYDFRFCTVRTPNLVFAKDVALHAETPIDCGIIPGSPDLAARAAIPGSCFQYDITVSNDGSGPSTSTTVTDVIGSDMIFAGAAFSGFGSANPGFSFIMPPALTDCGAAPCMLRLQDGVVGAGGSGSITVRTILK